MFDSENSQAEGQQELTNDETVSEQDAGSEVIQNDSPNAGESTDVSTQAEPAVNQSPVPSELDDLKQKYTGASNKLYEQKVAYRKLMAEHQQLQQFLAQQQQQRTQQPQEGQQQNTPWYRNPEAARWDLPTMGQNMDQHYRQVAQEVARREFQSAVQSMLEEEQRKQERETQAQTVTRVEGVINEMKQQYRLSDQEVGQLIQYAQENPHEFLRDAIKTRFADRLQQANQLKQEGSIAQKLAANAKQIVQSAQGGVPTKKPVDDRPWWERLEEQRNAKKAA